MPLATNPNSTLPVWLECDAEIPMAERPVFLCRFLTRHEINTFAAELDLVSTLKDATEAHRRLDAVLAKGIVGWRNMAQPGAGPIDFAPDRFDLILTPSEKWDLGFLMLQAPRMTEKESGGSPSSNTSTPDSSAPHVLGENAAKTS